jgi:hypothetical protein
MTTAYTASLPGSTAYLASLPSSAPLLFRQSAMEVVDYPNYPVMNLSSIFSQQFPPPPPILTQLEELAIEPLDDAGAEDQLSPAISDDLPPLPPAPQLPTAIQKLNELKSLMREFNFKMFSMPITVSNAMVADATDIINTIIDSPIQSSSAIYRPRQDVWVPLFERFFSTMEQLPNGPEMRELALDIEIAFTNILGEISDGNISYVEYTVTMFGSS